MTDLVVITLEPQVSVVIESPVATVVEIISEGPQGPKGERGADSTAVNTPARLDQATPASTWILPHSFDRVPLAQVYLSSGELVIADIAATTTTITVTFPGPQSGFVVLF